MTWKIATYIPGFFDISGFTNKRCPQKNGNDKNRFVRKSRVIGVRKRTVTVQTSFAETDDRPFVDDTVFVVTVLLLWA